MSTRGPLGPVHGREQRVKHFQGPASSPTHFCASRKYEICTRPLNHSYSRLIGYKREGIVPFHQFKQALITIVQTLNCCLSTILTAIEGHSCSALTPSISESPYKELDRRF